jgi:NADPH:quinone reductase-like Zn-dependent oxidoreductase
MCAAVLEGHGGFDRLVYRCDVPVPVPQPDEVLLRVLAAGVNNTDINLRAGWYSKRAAAGAGADAAGDAVHDATGDAAETSPRPATDTGWTGGTVIFPLIQGADVCGVVIATGSAVKAGLIGQRVLVDPVLHPRASTGFKTLYLGSDCDGGFADHVCVPAINAHPVANPLTDAELASFPCSYSAAENMLTRAAVVAGETVLVTGASGGVGSAAVQLAKRRGAVVIALAATSKAEQVAQLGAARVLPRDVNLPSVLGTDSVDVVVDAVGGAQFGPLLEVLRPGGRYAVAGAIAGPLVTLDLRTLYLKDLSFFGCTIPDSEVFPNLVRYIENGEIRPLVSRTYPLPAIAAAQREFLAKRHTGKIVLLP